MIHHHGNDSSTNSDQHSTGSEAAYYERSDRLFQQQGMWFFKTQEGKDVGPFRYRDEAELMLTRFIQEVVDKEQALLARAKPHFRTWAGIGSRRP